MNGGDNIYDVLIKGVEDGKKFSINFKTRSAKLDGKYIVKDGETEYALNKVKQTLENVLETIENLYEDYRFSMPSERSECKRRLYFKAEPEENLTTEQMCTGTPREVSRAKLEGYILENLLNGNLYWDDKMGLWYYHGEDPNLIMLKEWF